MIVITERAPLRGTASWSNLKTPLILLGGVGAIALVVIAVLEVQHRRRGYA